MSKYYDKTAASFKSVTIDTKVLDVQKILINPATGDSTERVNLLDFINESAGSADTTELYQRVSILEEAVEGGYKSIEFKSNTTGNSNETEGIAMQFSKAHFIPENVQLLLVSLPFTLEPRDLSNQYCHIWYYNDVEEVIAIHISNTTQSRTSGQTGKSTWTFPESCIVPGSYKYVRVFLSGVDYTIDFGRTSIYRINVVNKAGVTFDDDECCVWTSTSSNSNYLGDIEVTYGVYEKILDTITSIESDLNSRIDNVEETLIEKVTNLENSVFTYQDAVYDVNTMQGTLDNATIYGILYSKEHFGISGTQISKVTIPYNTQSGQTNTGYLVALVFGNDNQLIASYYSEGTHTFSNTGPAVFNFKDVYINTNYKFIRFILVANKTVDLPTAYDSINSNCLSFRARPIKLADSFTFDDDDCLIYSSQGTGVINWLVGMTITYKQRLENNSGNSGSSSGDSGSSANSEISDYIIESYSNGTEWYRLYKSGWVEQGGKHIWDGVTTTPREIPITLYKEMADTTYTVHTTSSNYTAAGYFPWVNSITTTGFILFASGTAGTRSDIFWRACGRTK